jgi:hypothetical protein
VKSTRLRRTALAVPLLLLLAGPALAQSTENPRLVLTITGGWITGGSLWRLPRQEASVAPGIALDTVALERRFRTGLVVGLGAALYRSPHFAYSGEIVFYGMSTESRCAPPAQWAADTLHINQQACTDIQGKNLRTSAAVLQLGVTWRPIATGAIQPYVRALAGPAYLGGSFVETSGTVQVPGDSGRTVLRLRTLLGDPNQRTLTWLVTLGGGVTFAIAPGTQVRFEARDVVTSLSTVTGPGDPLALGTPAQVGSTVRHLVSFTVGLDIVLEQARRPHRY